MRSWFTVPLKRPINKNNKRRSSCKASNKYKATVKMSQMEKLVESLKKKRTSFKDTM